MNERRYLCTKCKVYKANSPLTECDDCVEKQYLLEEKAAKWDVIQWAIDNNITFVETEGDDTFLINNDIDRLEQLYKEREQNER